MFSFGPVVCTFSSAWRSKHPRIKLSSKFKLGPQVNNNNQSWGCCLSFSKLEHIHSWAGTKYQQILQNLAGMEWHELGCLRHKGRSCTHMGMTICCCSWPELVMLSAWQNSLRVSVSNSAPWSGLNAFNANLSSVVRRRLAMDVSSSWTGCE